MPTLADIIAQGLRAKDVGPVSAQKTTPFRIPLRAPDPWGTAPSMRAQAILGAPIPDVLADMGYPQIKGQLERLPKPVQTALEFVMPSPADLAGGIARRGVRAAVLGKDFLEDVLQRATSKGWRPTPRGVFSRDVPDLQGTVAPDPRLGGIFERTPTQQRTGDERVRDLVDMITNSSYVQQGLEADAIKGLQKGGGIWYNPATLSQTMSPEEFLRYSLTGAGSSNQSSVPNELASNSIITYALKRGLTPDEALEAFSRTVYDVPARVAKETKEMAMPFLSGTTFNAEGLADAGTHYGNVQRALRAGIILPTELTSGAWKLPSYLAHRLGMGGLDPLMPGVFPALDTHEKTRQFQLALDPASDVATGVTELLQRMYPDKDLIFKPKGTGGVVPRIRGQFDKKTQKWTKVIPELTTTNDEYRKLGNMYIEGANRLGLPTAGAFQAARWVGGGLETGLKTSPEGDLAQIIEDMLAYSARVRNMRTDPKSLQKYWRRVVEGDDFIVPFHGKGKIPVE